MKFPNLLFAYSEKSEGNMSFKWGDEHKTSENRKKFLETVGVDTETIVGMQLQHGTDIAFVDETACGTETLPVDCLMTKSSEVFLSVLTGDCLPVIFYEPERRIVALAHISRTNAAMGFVSKIMAKMTEEGSAENILVWIGPGVRKESYILELPEGRIAFDLVGLVVRELRSSGVRGSNIEISEEDTIADTHFFSHYRSKKTGEPEGRMITLAGIVKGSEVVGN